MLPRVWLRQDFIQTVLLEGVHEGTNHLDGKRALAYSRERKAYIDGRCAACSKSTGFTSHV
ncbi:MAG: hypothetical protein ACLTTH_16435 [Holdemanella porci]